MQKGLSPVNHDHAPINTVQKVYACSLGMEHILYDLHSTMASSASFLGLPQELRDLIFEYAINTETVPTDLGKEERSESTFDISHRHLLWRVSGTDGAPAATYLNIMRCNRQLRNEIGLFLQHPKPDQATAKLELNLTYSLVTPRWTAIPAPPEQTSVLDINIKLGHMWHPALEGADAHEPILRPVFEILKRYISYGPNFGKPSRLQQPLKLDTVRMTVDSAVPVEDMTYVFDNPTLRLQLLFEQFKMSLTRLAHSGLPPDRLGAVEVRMDGWDWSRIPVFADMWEEQDYLRFKSLGFDWDA